MQVSEGGGAGPKAKKEEEDGVGVAPQVAAAAEAAASSNAGGSGSRAFQTTARRQRMCVTRAVGIVELMARGSVPVRYLELALPRLTKQHYADAVTERNLAGACGFPACGARLPDDPQPNRRYQICSATKRVYDITRRKSYCSDLCFARSTFAQDRIPDLPLWLRDSEPPPPASSLADLLAGVRPRPGDPVSLDPVADDLARLRLRDGDADLAGDARPPTSERSVTSTKVPVVAATPSSVAWLDRLVPAGGAAAAAPTASPSSAGDPKAAAFATSSDWCTAATRDFLLLPQRRQRPKFGGGRDENGAASTAAATTLQLLGNETATPPCATSVEIVERNNPPAGHDHHRSSKHDESRPLPPVDSACQSALRRRVVHEKLAAFVGSAAARLGLGLDCVSGDLRCLVDTFKLTSGNIALATSVWEILAWLVLLLLLRRRKDLRQSCAARLPAEAASCLGRHRGVTLAVLLEQVDRLLLEPEAASAAAAAAAAAAAGLSAPD